VSKRLVDALSRAGVAQLCELAGKAAVNLLERIESKALTGRGLAEIVVDRRGGGEALCDPKVRALVLESLRPDEAESLCSVLGLVATDAFAALMTVDFGRSETQLATLHAFFGVVYEEHNVEDSPARSTLTPPYTLFSHQRQASLRVREKLDTGRRRVLLHMPTGPERPGRPLRRLSTSSAGSRMVKWSFGSPIRKNCAIRPSTRLAVPGMRLGRMS
jgi:DNA repair protein RadD